MKQFEKLKSYPPELKGRFNQFIVTQFDDSMTVEMQLRSLIKWIKANIDLTNSMVKYLNEFIKTFDEKLYDTLTDVLNVWLDDGRLAEVIAQIALRMDDFEEKINGDISDIRNDLGDFSGFRDWDKTIIDKMKNEFTERGLNVKWFGAKGDGVTDDTKAIQAAIDHVIAANKGTLILDGAYLISEPLLFDRLNEDNLTNIVLTGGGTLINNVKGAVKRMITLKLGFHDEDNIVFDNLSFDGVNHTVNGIDSFNENVPYNMDGNYFSDGNQTKFITFNRCVFKRFYRALRLSSLSFSFRDCLFQDNIYGGFANLAFNNNNFFNCQFRRNVVGFHLKQLDATLGSVNNNFFGCNFESNQNAGLIIEGAFNTLLSGCYFENNCYNLTNLAIKPDKTTHIQLIGNLNYLTLNSVFCNLDTDYLIYSDSYIIGLEVSNTTNHKIKTFLLEASNLGESITFSNIDLTGVWNFDGDFIIKGEKYLIRKQMIFEESKLKATFNENYKHIQTRAFKAADNLLNCEFKDGNYIMDVVGTIELLSESGNYHSVGSFKIVLGVSFLFGEKQIKIMSQENSNISEFELFTTENPFTIVGGQINYSGLNAESRPNIGLPNRTRLNMSVDLAKTYFDDLSNLSVNNLIIK